MEQWNSVGGTVIVKKLGGTVKQCLLNSVVEQWNSVGGIVEQCRWKSGTVFVK